MLSKKTNIKPRTKRVIAIQENTLTHYEKIVFITTDKEIISLLQTIIPAHQEINEKLKATLNPVKLAQKPIKKITSYLAEAWEALLIDLIVNNQPKILEYISQSETKLLQEVTTLLKKQEENQVVYSILQVYEKEIYQHLSQLDTLIRAYKNKNYIPNIFVR